MSEQQKEQYIENFEEDCGIYNNFMDIFHSHMYERLYDDEEYSEILEASLFY